MLNWNHHFIISKYHIIEYTVWKFTTAYHLTIHYIYIITYYITYIYILYKLNCCWHHHLSWWFTSPASPMEPPARGIEGDWNPLLRSLEIWKFAISFVASKCLKNHSTDFLGVLCFQYHGLSIKWSNPGSISNNLRTWHKRHFEIILPTNQSHVGWRRG